MELQKLLRETSHELSTKIEPQLNVYMQKLAQYPFHVSGEALGIILGIQRDLMKASIDLRAMSNRLAKFEAGDVAG